MRTSYSALDTYKTCPQKYKYSQIDKLREPKRIETVFGTLIHSSLKYMFERNPLYPTLDEVVNNFILRWKEKSDLIQWRDVTRKNEEGRLYVDEGIKLLKNFYKKNQPWLSNTIELEGRFEVELNDDATGKTHTLSGIIDRIDKNPESDVYEIIDYKTGKKMPSEESLKNNLQLGVYHLALSKKWPSYSPDKIITSLYFLKHNEKISTTLTKEMLDATRNGVLIAIREIEEKMETGDFPPTPGPLCNWCGFRSICPMWSHEYKTETKQNIPEEKELADAVRTFFEIKIAETENKKHLAGARDIIERYMKSKTLARVFGTGGYITRTEQERVSYDMEQVKPILEKIGKWEEILSPDEKKLTALINGLSEDEQEALFAIQKTKSFSLLKHTKK